MHDFSRRGALKAAAWSVPVIAVAATTPLAAASVPLPPLTATITDITYTGSFDRYRLSIAYTNVPADKQLTGRLSWSSAQGSTIGSSLFFVDAAGTSIILTGFPTGELITFTARINGADPDPMFVTYNYTFGSARSSTMERRQRALS